VVQTIGALPSRGGVPQVNGAWLAVSLVAYLAGLTLDGLWFGRVLDASATPISRLATVRAYLISHLGKYVPGKAMVVVLRVAYAVPAGARASTAAVASVYETLVMMAAGGFVAAVGFSLALNHTISLPLGPLGRVVVPLGVAGFMLGLAFLGLALPEVFGRVAKRLGARVRGVGAEAMPHISYRLLGEGLLWTAAGWVLLGLSQLTVLHALGWQVPAGAWPAVVGSVALATVGGFIVPVAPGGLGVREWVLWTSLGAVINHEQAVVASLALRLVWVAAEVMAAGVLVLWKPAAPLQAPPPDVPSMAEPL
jgi:uncharacterized membrane protein YbhN (UPF0104 family)